MALENGVCLLAERRQQLPPFMVFSVQLATEFTSLAAPRTVLQAATARAKPSNATVANF